MEVKSFYGHEKRSLSARSEFWQQKRTKLEKLANEYRKHPIPRRRNPRIGEPSPVFSKWFPRQQMAFDFARTCHKDIHVFAEERSSDGKRHYLVSTLPSFWDVYKRINLEDRHYYEVIMQGAACRLYFDLEFKADLNPEHSGPEMVKIFKKLICRSLQSLLHVNCEDRNILDLDSSTVMKFSRHLIFHIPGAVFQNNITAGNFVKHICNLVVNRTRQHFETSHKDASMVSSSAETTVIDTFTEGELEKLMVKNDKGEWTIFCDQGVYTRNRNFRLYKSTKIGRNAPLLLAKENQFKISLNDKELSFYRDEEYLLFVESLICSVSPLTGSGQDVRVLSWKSDKHQSSFKNGKIGQTHNQDDENIGQSGFQCSPYPEIDQFISKNISKGGVPGHIRRWVYFQQGKTLTYDILNNRWCENIGRPHKSNNIMMVVNLEHRVYYQKCHDPDCRQANFKSKELPLPDEIFPFRWNEVHDLSSDGDDCGDDELLCRAAAEAEYQYQLQCKAEVAHFPPVSGELTYCDQSASNFNKDATKLDRTCSPCLAVPEQRSVSNLTEHKSVARDISGESTNAKNVQPQTKEKDNTTSYSVGEKDGLTETREFCRDEADGRTNLETELEKQLLKPEIQSKATKSSNSWIDDSADEFYFEDDGDFEEKHFSQLLTSLENSETSDKNSFCTEKTFSSFCKNRDMEVLNAKDKICSKLVGSNNFSSFTRDISEEKISGDIRDIECLQQSGKYLHCLEGDYKYCCNILSNDDEDRELMEFEARIEEEHNSGVLLSKEGAEEASCS